MLKSINSELVLTLSLLMLSLANVGFADIVSTTSGGVRCNVAGGYQVIFLVGKNVANTSAAASCHALDKHTISGTKVTSYVHQAATHPVLSNVPVDCRQEAMRQFEVHFGSEMTSDDFWMSGAGNGTKNYVQYTHQSAAPGVNTQYLRAGSGLKAVVCQVKPVVNDGMDVIRGWTGGMGHMY